MFFLLFSLPLSAYTKVSDEEKARKKDKKKRDEQVMRDYVRFWDLQKNTVSNIEFYTTNYGIFGNNVTAINAGGGWWPRNSQNQYIFGGGLWFGAVKDRPNAEGTKKYVTVTYNPSNGRSWMVPGRIEDGDLKDESDIYKYRTFFSTDFNLGTGEPFDEDHTSNWPIWDTEEEEQLKKERYVGYYVNDEALRNTDEYPKGPAFISGEDIFCTYKDTDLNEYDGGFNLRKDEGYPLRIQYEQIIYSWGFGDYKDFIFIKYKLMNYSSDTLMDCWAASVMDMDIANSLNARQGAANDRVTFYFPDESLDLAVQWTNTDFGEQGQGFGYIGMDFLESPAVDEDGFVRKDKKFYPNEEQLGLKTSFNWPIEEDINEDERRYNTMASGEKMGDAGPGDRRFMMSTGPFNLRPAQNVDDPENIIPGDTIDIVVGIILASPVKGKDADGSWEDMSELVRKDKFAQRVYDNNFLAPEPPWRARFKAAAIDDLMHNGVIIKWDSTSEVSRDEVEGAMDFLGYRLYRARRTDLDTFATNYEAPTLEYSSGKGPLGWKQIAQWELPTPFFKSEHKVGEGNEADPNIDRLMIVGPAFKPNGDLDTLGIKVIRQPYGVYFNDPVLAYNNSRGEQNMTRQYAVPQLQYIDSSEITEPWGRFYYQMSEEDGIPFEETEMEISGETVRVRMSNLYITPFDSANSYHYDLMEDVMMGEFRIDPANPTWNPLLYRKEVIRIQDTSGLQPYDPETDTYYLLDTWRRETINGSTDYYMDVMKSIDWKDAMNDYYHVQAALDSIYDFVQDRRATLHFPDFVYEYEKHDVLNEVVLPYMDKITNGRTFYDIGDDNRDGYVYSDPDPAKTEKLINNVDYYYKLLSYDEGDINQPTPSKLNSGGENLPNFTERYPRAARVGNQSTFEITYVDSSRIGGLYNFRFYPVNQQRVDQYFAGHELELEFQPYWYQDRREIDGIDVYFGPYQNRIKLTDLTTGELLYDGIASYNNDNSLIQMFTEDAASYVFSVDAIPDTAYMKGDRPDTLLNTFGLVDNRQIVMRTGEYNTGNFLSSFANPNSLNMMGKAYGTLGFSFNYSIEQWGGRYRPDKESMRPSEEDIDNKVPYDKTPIYIVQNKQLNRGANALDKVLLTQAVETPLIGYPTYGSFNNGPAEYHIKFKEGGYEEITVKYDRGFGGDPVYNEQKTFNVPYLEMEVTNHITYKRPAEPGSADSVLVEYIKEVPFLQLPKDYDLSEPFPTPVLLGKNSNEFIGKYNQYSVGWVNGRGANFLEERKAYAYPVDFDRTVEATTIGTQGRYYLTAQNGEDILDFTNVFQASGCYYLLDYANHNAIKPGGGSIEGNDKVDDDVYTYGQDFQPGDEIVLKTFGGALGYPLPGAKVRCKVSSHLPEEDKYTDDMMSDIKIVPNPFYLTSQAQKSPYENKIFITKLPPRATIDIFTLNGDHVETIEHNEYNSPEADKATIEVWDLLTKNGFRISSQVLVAVIKTPDGSQHVQQFTVLVGPFRIQQSD